MLGELQQIFWRRVHLSEALKRKQRKMKTQTKTLIAALGAVLFIAAPAVANAERVYFLVGTRHVYRVGNDEYARVDDRKVIEQNYADQVAKDQEEYDKLIQGGSTPEKEGPDFNKALEDLATERDNQLGAIYEKADEEAVRHPELRVEGDGPYQVMGVEMHVRYQREVIENIVVDAPWQGYEVVERPYGWEYGTVYAPTEFVRVYGGWHAQYVADGRPAYIGIVGHRGEVKVVGLGRGDHGEFVRGPLPRDSRIGGKAEAPRAGNAGYKPYKPLSNSKPSFEGQGVSAEPGKATGKKPNPSNVPGQTKTNPPKPPVKQNPPAKNTPPPTKKK